MEEYYNKLDDTNQRVFKYYERARKNANLFIETGCNVGNSLTHVKQLGYQSFSCDIDLDCVRKCEGLGEIYHLDSVSFLKKIIPDLNERALFWLDAHDNSQAPIFEELDVIATSKIKDHIIMIDDLPLYFKGRYQEIEDKIKAINPNYQIEYGFTRWEDYILYGSVNGI